MADSPIVSVAQVRSFRQLIVWQKSMDLAVDVHRAARLLPTEVRFELGREMRRSATSVPSNVAEGFCRHSRPAYRSHVAMASGSGAELDTQIELAGRLDFLEASRVRELLDRVGEVNRLLQGLWNRLAPLS